MYKKKEYECKNEKSKNEETNDLRKEGRNNHGKAEK